MNTSIRLKTGIIDFLFGPARKWISGMPINNVKRAELIARLVPQACPFEQTISIFGHTIVRIPPLCKLNPTYDQLVELRYRAINYLAEAGEDVARWFQ